MLNASDVVLVPLGRKRVIPFKEGNKEGNIISLRKGSQFLQKWFASSVGYGFE
jgi:hypothetical protein